MTQEEKELLLKDLCARLPYGVYVLVHDTFKYSTVPYENVYLKSSDASSLIDSISLNERYNSKDKLFNRIIKEHKDFLEFKPYLRPMSSMREEEKKDILQSLNIHGDIDNEGNLLLGVECNIITLKVCKKYLGELNKRMFDVCHMIEKGLALEAKEGMYKTE